MITYNPKDCFFFLFKFYKDNAFRTLIPLLISFFIYTSLVVVLENKYNFSLKYLEVSKSFSIVFSILGFTLSFMLVFRTNTAYDRWWEGRKQWG